MEEPVAAPQGTEAMPNTNPAPAPEAPAAPAAPATPIANIPADKIEEFNRFVAGNGGFEKAFAKLRSDVSTPAPAQPIQQPQPAYEAPQTIAQPAPQPVQKIPSGYITQEEFAAQQYYESLSRDPAYAPISNQIRSGEIFKEMSKFGIKPMQNGAINDRQVRDFLNLYAKATPAPVPAAPVTNTPTVEYVNVGDKITSREDALAVLRQNMSLGNNASHPQTAAARDFLKQYFNSK